MDEYGANQKLKHPRIGFLPTAKSLTWDLPGNKNLKQKNWNGLHYQRPKEEDHKGYPPKQSKNLGVWFLPVSHQNLVGSLSFLNSFSVLGSQSKIGSKRHHRGRPSLHKKSSKMRINHQSGDASNSPWPPQGSDISPRYTTACSV